MICDFHSLRRGTGYIMGPSLQFVRVECPDWLVSSTPGSESPGHRLLLLLQARYAALLIYTSIHISSGHLPWHHTTSLSHSSVLFLKSLTQPLRALEDLVDAASNATLFLGRKAFGCEVVDAVFETVLHHVRVHLVSVSLCFEESCRSGEGDAHS